MPANEGRGYVLRRIMRRAIRMGKKLGLQKPFMHKTSGFVIEQMKDAYPSLIDQRAFIEKVVLAEEEQFLMTSQGQDLMASAIYRAFRDYKTMIENKTNVGVNANQSETKTTTTTTTITKPKPIVQTETANTQSTVTEPKVEQKPTTTTTTIAEPTPVVTNTSIETPKSNTQPENQVVNTTTITTQTTSNQSKPTEKPVQTSSSTTIKTETTQPVVEQPKTPTTINSTQVAPPKTQVLPQQINKPKES